MKTRYLTASVAIVAMVSLRAQTFVDVRQLYDAGKYREAVDAAAAVVAVPARVLYLQAQSHERLGEAAEAASVYTRLRDTAAPVWRSIAESALARQSSQTADALAAATRAVEQDANTAEAHFQLGLALGGSADPAKAAAAFDRAAELDPQWSYARYYAGLSYYKAKRIDLLADRFEAFLKLAPNAPERPEVESIMRTLRGR